MFESPTIIIVHIMGFLITGRFRRELLFESSPLVQGVIELTKSIGKFFAANKEFKAVDKKWIRSFLARQR